MLVSSPSAAARRSAESLGSVLVVEPDAGARDAILWSLRHSGVSTLWAASDGSEALELALRHHPDLVLSEIALPGLDGLALAAALIEAELDADLVFLTADPSAAGDADLVALNVVGLLSKPFPVFGLAKRVVASLSRHARAERSRAPFPVEQRAAAPLDPALNAR